MMTCFNADYGLFWLNSLMVEISVTKWVMTTAKSNDAAVQVLRYGDNPI